MRIRLEDVRKANPKLRGLLDDASLLYHKIQEKSREQFDRRNAIASASVKGLSHQEVRELQRIYDKMKPLLRCHWERYNSLKRQIAIQYQIGYLNLLDTKRGQVIRQIALSNQVRTTEPQNMWDLMVTLKSQGLSEESARQVASEYFNGN